MDYLVSTMLSIWRKLMHGILDLNHVVFLEKIQGNGLYESMKSWKINVIIKDRGIDYLALTKSSFMRKFNNGPLGLNPVVLF